MSRLGNMDQDSRFLSALMDFLKVSPLPGSLVSNNGYPIYVNPALSRHISADIGDGPYRCNWVERVEGECPYCAETPTISGRCFIPKDKTDLFLLAAIRVSNAKDALVRLYSTTETLQHHNCAQIVGQLLNICSVGAIAQTQEKGFLKLGRDWLCKAKLWDIVDSAINSDSTTVDPVFNKVDQRCVLEATSPMVIEQIIIKVLQELSKVDSQEGIIIRSMKHAGTGNAPASYVLSFLTKSKKLIGKGSSSLLTASGLWLKKNCQTLAAAIGIELSAPKLFHHDQVIEAQLTIPGRLKRTVGGHGLGDSPKLANLSSREREIVVMVRVGYDNEEISNSLGITHATVKQHLKAIYKKSSVKNRIQLIFMDLAEAV